jgi:hypothetical protein
MPPDFWYLLLRLRGRGRPAENSLGGCSWASNRPKNAWTGASSAPMRPKTTLGRAFGQARALRDVRTRPGIIRGARIRRNKDPAPLCGPPPRLPWQTTSRPLSHDRAPPRAHLYYLCTHTPARGNDRPFGVAGRRGGYRCLRRTRTRSTGGEVRWIIDSGGGRFRRSHRSAGGAAGRARGRERMGSPTSGGSSGTNSQRA